MNRVNIGPKYNSIITPDTSLLGITSIGDNQNSDIRKVLKSSICDFISHK